MVHDPEKKRKIKVTRVSEFMILILQNYVTQFKILPIYNIILFGKVLCHEFCWQINRVLRHPVVNRTRLDPPRMWESIWVNTQTSRRKSFCQEETPDYPRVDLTVSVDPVYREKQVIRSDPNESQTTLLCQDSVFSSGNSRDFRIRTLTV